MMVRRLRVRRTRTGEIHEHRLPTAAPQRRLDGTRRSRALHHVITMTSDGTARIWDPVAAQVVRPPIRYPGFAFWHISFNSDGRLLLTTDDQSVLLTFKIFARCANFLGGVIQ